jgi:hypothetical protein
VWTKLVEIDRQFERFRFTPRPCHAVVQQVEYKDNVLLNEYREHVFILSILFLLKLFEHLDGSGFKS